jgi:hypothetical protein
MRLRMMLAVLGLAASAAVLAAHSPAGSDQKFGRATVHPRHVAAETSRPPDAVPTGPVLSRRAQAQIKDRKTGHSVRSGE